MHRYFGGVQIRAGKIRYLGAPLGFLKIESDRRGHHREDEGTGGYSQDQFNCLGIAGQLF